MKIILTRIPGIDNSGWSLSQGAYENLYNIWKPALVDSFYFVQIPVALHNLFPTFAEVTTKTKHFVNLIQEKYVLFMLGLSQDCH